MVTCVGMSASKLQRLAFICTFIVRRALCFDPFFLVCLELPLAERLPLLPP